MDRQDLNISYHVEQLFKLLAKSNEKTKQKFLHLDEIVQGLIYVDILRNLIKSIKTGNKDSFIKLSKLLSLITNAIDPADVLKHFFKDSDNPFIQSNIIIEVCKNNQADFLKYIFSSQCSIITDLSIKIGQKLPLPADSDEECHNAFYYAIRSGNTQLLEVLLKNWHDDYFSSHPIELCCLLSKNYNELVLKNVDITKEMKLFIHSILLDHYLENKYSHSCLSSYTHKDINERISLILECYNILKKESNSFECENLINLLSKLIALNIFILKRWLKSTYDRIPWEEMEYHLISFIRYLNHKGNCFNCAVTKTDIITYLGYFTDCLVSETNQINNINLKELGKIRHAKREDIVKLIVSKYPFFKELYKNYELIRDTESLNIIKTYVDIASEVNPKEKSGQTIIIRSLQVMGENLKNTLESPKISSATSDYLMSFLPRDTYKVLTSLRNSFSHGFPLWRCKEIEEIFGTEFYVFIQNDLKQLNHGITVGLHEIKLKLLKNLLGSIFCCENNEKLKETFHMLSTINLDDIDQSAMPKNNIVIELEKIIADLKNIVKVNTQFEKNLFSEIDNIIANEKNYLKDFNGYDCMFLLFLSHISDSSMNDSTFPIIKKIANDLLNALTLESKSPKLKEIGYLAMKILKVVRHRIDDENLFKMNNLIYKILFIVENQEFEVDYLLELKNNFNNALKFNKINSSVFHKQDLLLNDLTALKTIIDKHNFSENDFGSFFMYKKNHVLQTEVEMLILSILSTLEAFKHPLITDNISFDCEYPLLVGKNLRNHLAHGNSLVEVLMNPAESIFLFAVKINKKPLETFSIFEKQNSRLEIDQNKLNVRSQLENMLYLRIQNNLFEAIFKGVFKDVDYWIKQGADVYGTNNSRMTALHFAAGSPNIEIFKFLIDCGLNTHAEEIEKRNVLHIASASGRKDIVDYIITKLGILVDDVCKNNNKTPLHYAAENDCVDVVKTLINNKANIDLRDISFMTPLYKAVENNCLKVVSFLLRNVNKVDSIRHGDGFTLLHNAAEKGYSELVRYLLDKGASVHSLTDRGATPLHLTSFFGHLEVVKLLVASGAKVNMKTTVDGLTSLHHSVEKGHYSVVEFLLKNGADVNVLNGDGHSPLHYAIGEKHAEVLKLLIKHGANTKVILPDGTSLIEYAVLNGNLDTFSILIKNGASINVINDSGDALLHLSVKTLFPEIAKWLIKNGADVNARDKNGVTPLFLAVSLGRTEIFNELILNGADVSVVVDSYTLLHICATTSAKIHTLIKNCESIVENVKEHFISDNEMLFMFEKLVEKGAAFEKKTNLGQTPLHLACLSGNIKIVQFLLKKSVNINSPDCKGYTPLHYAVEGNHINAVENLLANQCGINCTTLNGDTALCIASQLNYIEMCRYLIKYGADINIGYPLHKALQNGYQEICEILLRENGIDTKSVIKDIKMSILQLASSNGLKRVVSIILASTAIIVTAEDIENSLKIAVMLGHDNIVTMLLNAGADVNKSFEEDSTPLHLAAIQGHSKIIEILLDRGADLNKLDEKKRKPLELAVAHNHLETVKICFKDRNVKINDHGNDNFTLLHIAANHGHLDIVKALISEGAKLNVENFSGSKPIHIAARDGHLHIVQYFIECVKVDIKERGCKGMNLLHYAAQAGKYDVANYLIKKGIDVNEPDNSGRRPIHLAAFFGFEELLKLLMENGSSYNCKDNLGNTPLNYANNQSIKSSLLLIEELFHSVKTNDISKMKSLVKKDVCVNAKDSGPAAPLHYAAWKGYAEIAKYLLENKGDPNSTGKNGLTPLHYASKFNNFEIAKMLLENGAIYNALSIDKKTPLQLTKNEEIMDLLKLIENSFQCVQNCDCKILKNLKRIRNSNNIKALLNSQNMNNRTLMACAVFNDFPKIEKLKNFFFEENKTDDMISSYFAVTENYEEALKIQTNLLRKKKEKLGSKNPATLETEENRAKILYKQQKYQQALDIFQKIYEDKKTSFGKNNKHTLKTQSFIALVLHRLGRNSEAIEISDEVYKKQCEILSETDDELLSTLSDRALILNDLEKHEEALKANQTVFERRLRKYGLNHFSTLVSQNNIGQTLAYLKKYDEAIATYKTVYEARKKVIGPLHSDTLRTLHNLNCTYCVVNKSDEAVNGLREVLKLQESALGPKHIDTLKTENEIGVLLFESGKPAEAFKILKENVRKQKTVLGDKHPSLEITEKIVEIMRRRFEIEGPQGASFLSQLENFGQHYPLSKETPFEDALLNTVDSEGRSPLHFAVSENQVSAVKELLLRGCNAMHITNKGNTTLHIASSKGNTEILELLLKNVKESNSDKLYEFVNAKTKNGENTALHAAANVEIVKILLKYGSIYNVKNKIGKTPKDQTSVKAISDFLQLIYEFFLGASTGDSKIIGKLKLLDSIEQSAVLNVRNEQNYTLLQVSLINRQKEISKQLSLLLKSEIL